MKQYKQPTTLQTETMSNAGHSQKSALGVDLNLAMHVLKTLQIMNERGSRTLLGNFCEACGVTQVPISLSVAGIALRHPVVRPCMCAA